MHQNPHLILVEPQNPANLGFVARVADNFGMGALRTLQGCAWQDSEAERTGAPARARLEEVEACSTWGEATRDCTHLVGFTARAGGYRSLVSLHEWDSALAAIPQGSQLGFVFGREDRGLETEEVERCHLLISIPTSGLGSLNLSHAVAVACDAWRRFSGGASMPIPTNRDEVVLPEDADYVASQAQRDRLAMRAAEEIELARFPDERSELAATMRRLSALPIQSRDLRMLDRVLRHVRWLREQEAAKGD